MLGKELGRATKEEMKSTCPPDISSFENRREGVSMVAKHYSAKRQVDFDF